MYSTLEIHESLDFNFRTQLLLNVQVHITPQNVGIYHVNKVHKRGVDT